MEYHILSYDLLKGELAKRRRINEGEHDLCLKVSL